MPEKLRLYDIPCKGRCACWSGNVWKTRLVLNYKGIPYETTWIEHPDIVPKMKELGIEPSSGPGSPYTVPVIQFADGTAIMDSAIIAAKLESLYPMPPLHLELGLQDKLQPILGKIAPPLIPVFMPRVARQKLLDSSVAFFREARQKAFGVTLEEMEQARGGDKAWAAAQPGLDELKGFLTEHKQDEGPFVLGSQPSYADFVLMALLEGFRRIDQDIYDNLVSGDERLSKLHQACQRWTEDDQ